MEEVTNFSATGEGVFNFMLELTKEGNFDGVVEILEKSGIGNHNIGKLVMGKFELKGDTRTPQGIFLEKNNTSDPKLFNEIVKSIGGRIDRDVDYLGQYKRMEFWKSLCEFIDDEMLTESIQKYYLRKMNYKVLDFSTEGINRLDTGVLLANGDFIGCGYMGHDELYFHLRAVGITYVNSWTDDDVNIHVSSGSYSGANIYGMRDYNYITNPDKLPTTQQLKTMLKFKNMTLYGLMRENVPYLVFKSFVAAQNHGGKYGGLMFLKEFYPHIKTPEISKTPFTDGVFAIRTSPRKSMAGVLKSKFGITYQTYGKYLDDMFADWVEHKDLIRDNEFNVFYQREVEGLTGVAHISINNVSYQLSNNKGDVVNGKETNIAVSKSEDKRIKKVLSSYFDKLSFLLDSKIQVEFVIDEIGQIVIVQIRLFPKTDKVKNEIELNVGCIYNAKGFTEGKTEILTENDVLIVDKDCENTSALKDKKALIVRSDVEFSHVLALSSSLGIPSIYGFGNRGLPEKFRIVVYGSVGYVYMEV